MHLRLIDYALWIAAPMIICVTLAVMYKRGLHRTYPYFFAYGLFEVFTELLLFVVNRQSYDLYYKTYYATIFVSAVLSIGVLYDITKNALLARERLRKAAMIAFRSCVVVFLAFAILNLVANRTRSMWWTEPIMLTEHLTRIAQCLLILFLVLFRKYLGISRRNVLFGIAFGFGMFAAVNMLVVQRLEGGIRFESVLAEINGVAYTAACLIWLVYVVRGSSQLDALQGTRSA